MMHTDVAALVLRLLVRSANYRDAAGLRGRTWRLAYRASVRRWGGRSVVLPLHNRSARLNFDNPYPLFQRSFENYNAPQTEVVLLAAEVLGRPVEVVDVGAATGDTALLLLDRCDAVLKSLDCVEGEPRFFDLLIENVASPKVRCHHVMLSNSIGRAPALVRNQHEGTASAQGATTVQTTTLDEIVATTDVIKIDTDGYDGLILQGSTRLLAQLPLVLFEWHPIACRAVGTDERLGFTTLDRAGYQTYLFFNKFGEFSHYMFGVDDHALVALRQLCLESNTFQDWHYDVMALPAGSASAKHLVTAAGLERSRRR